MLEEGYDRDKAKDDAYVVEIVVGQGKDTIIVYLCVGGQHRLYLMGDLNTIANERNPDGTSTANALLVRQQIRQFIEDGRCLPYRVLASMTPEYVLRFLARELNTESVVLTTGALEIVYDPSPFMDKLKGMGKLVNISNFSNEYKQLFDASTVSDLELTREKCRLIYTAHASMLPATRTYLSAYVTFHQGGALNDTKELA